jgi:prevent-host-death family protein
MMARWQTADAKQRFGDPVEAAGSFPQVVMRHRKPVAVVISPEEYSRLARQADAKFARLPARSPFDATDAQPVGMRLAGDG